MNRGIVVGSLICCFVNYAWSAENSLGTARSLVERWIEVRTVIAETRKDWTVEKEILDQTIAAFERESNILKRQLEEVGTGSGQIDQELSENQAIQESLRTTGAELKKLVARQEARIKELAPGFPAPVAENLTDFLNRLPEDPDQTKKSLSERLLTVAAILIELNKFNSTVTVASEMRTREDGTEIQAQVLYLGLGQAFFCDRTGEFCGYGIPSKTGWKWTSVPRMGPAIAKAIAVYENAEPAAIVPLPVTVE